MAGPKLLDKRIISAELATQKKQQIDTGIALAKKVDSVRETLAEEEKRLELFRINTIKQVQQEIDIKINEREQVKKETQIILKRIAEGNEALTEREQQLNAKEHYLNKRFEALGNIINEIN